ncbi:Gfo/Idh/MocA family oxidoreductase [candidate division KSB1 bacterium]|nr:Gfo/Idh/MocA family oxidoreductase [candidate division KSB1 bacterium]
MEKLDIAVIGCGYWGPNLVRNFYQLSDCAMKYCCDLCEDKLKRMASLFPSITPVNRLEDIITNAEIQAVAIATPVYSHYKIARACLEQDKHVLIEKPMASSTEECLELIALANQRKRVLMVGHTFEYTAAVNKAKEIVASGELGEIYYISCVRVNLGLFQPDINVVWDLAPHDISIISYILNQDPVSVGGQGKAHYNKNIEDVAIISLNYPNGTIAFIHNSWLDPDKIRKITIVGSKKMLVYDDINPNEKLKIYDKGVETPPYYDTYAEFQFSYRYGDIHTPHINNYEPLRKECEHFVECIRDNKRPRSDGYSGLRVVSILEAANRSLRNGGGYQKINQYESARN